MAKRTRSMTFSDIALEQEFLSQEQLKSCLEAQDGARQEGRPVPPLEQLVVEKGFMTAAQVRACKTALSRLQREAERQEPSRIGNYEILGKLGDGGLGTVYKARQLSMGRDVALKVLHKKWLADDEFKKRFLLEARLAGRLSHQNLIQVFDVGRDRGTYYFSMEFVDGETVDDILERDGALPISQALDITVQILRAIAHIQKFSIVHRDIKPGNIMVTRSGIAKLGDFGFVKSKLDSVIAADGEVLGTPDYIAPEQAIGSTQLDWRADQYSLGCSLYHMVTGRPPYEGSGSQVMRKHLRASLPDPREFNADIPDSVCHLLERMLAKDPGDRYQELDDLFEDLELVRMGQNPATSRLDVGKSTIIRAYRIEHRRAARAQNEVGLLRTRVKKLEQMFYVALFVAGLLAVALVVVLVMFAGK